MKEATTGLLRPAGRVVLRAGLALSLLIFVGIGVGPWSGRYRVVTVLTGSMRPTLPVGSLAISTPVPAGRLRVGDVVTYQAPLADHRVVTHRVVAIVEGGAHPVIQTKGDANPTPDPWLARLGSGPAWRVGAALPHLGVLLRWLRQPAVHRATVLGVPFLLLVGWLRLIWSDSPKRPLTTPSCP